MKKMFRKSVWILLGGMMIFHMVGCSGSETANQGTTQAQGASEAPNKSAEPVTSGKGKETAEAEGSPKEIVVWIPSNQNGSERDYYYEMLGKIDDAHSEFTLKIAEQADLSNQLLSAIISNDLPDLTMSDGNRLGVFCHAGVFLPLDEYFPDEAKKDWLPSIIDECTYSPDGRLYNIAQYDSGLALWANKAMLEEIGARIPTSYKEAWSKEEFEDICYEYASIKYN